MPTPLSSNPFRGLSLAQLAIIQTAWLDCLMGIARIGTSYSMNNRSWTHADLKEVKDTLSEIADAISLLDGTLITQCQATV